MGPDLEPEVAVEEGLDSLLGPAALILGCCGMMVISSLILSGFSSVSLFALTAPLVDEDVFLSMTLFATTLCAEYTWFSNSLYMPNVAVQTVHLYDRWAGFRVIPWSRATWFSSFHWYTCGRDENNFCIVLTN